MRDWISTARAMTATEHRTLASWRVGQDDSEFSMGDNRLVRGQDDGEFFMGDDRLLGGRQDDGEHHLYRGVDERQALLPRPAGPRRGLGRRKLAFLLPLGRDDARHHLPAHPAHLAHLAHITHITHPTHPAHPTHPLNNIGPRANRGLAVLALCLLLLLAACGGGNPKTSNQPKPRPTATATAGPGAQLLAQSAQLLNSAQTLHGLFNATLSGQLVNGEVDSEVWRLAPDKSRTLVTNSTLNQFASGTLIVSDGKHIWQYNPAQKVVYYGPVTSASATNTPGSGANQNNMQQLLLGAVQTVFTHSTATLISSKDTVNGHPVYTIQVASQQNQSNPSGGLSFSYTGTVSLDQQTKLPLALDLSIPGFAAVQIAIPSLELNKLLNSDLFTFTPPPGTKVESFPTSTGQGGSSLTLQQAEQQAGYHLLSIPTAQSAYHLQSIDALGAPGNQIYALTYTFNGQTFTISEGKSLANLPISGQRLSLRGTTATLSTSGTTSTLSWTEKSVGIQITGPLTKDQIVATANVLS